jgi:hypothetical protein
MASNIEAIGRAIMDARRRRADLPTRAENIEARAKEAIAQREALAKAGISEQDLRLKTNEADFQPTAQAQTTATHEAELAGQEATTGATRATEALTRAKIPQASQANVGPGVSRVDAEGKLIAKGALTPAMEQGGAAGLRLITEPDPENPGQERQRWVHPTLGETYGKGGDTDARLHKVGQIVEILGGLAVKLNQGIDPSVSGRIQGAWMRMSAMLNLNPDAQVYGDSV